MKKIIQISGGHGEVFALTENNEVFYMDITRRSWELLPEINQSTVVGGLPTCPQDNS